MDFPPFLAALCLSHVLSGTEDLTVLGLVIDNPVLLYVRTDFHLKVKGEGREGEGRRKKGAEGTEKGKMRETEGVIVTKVCCELLIDQSPS